MKKLLILSLTLFLVKSLVAMNFAGSTMPFSGNGNPYPDTVRKKVSHPFPGFPGQRKTAVKKKVYPLGTLKVRTEIPARFSFDSDTAVTMTPYHLVVIYKVPAGQHTLTFSDSLMQRSKTIMVDTMTTGYYKLLKDTTIIDSVVKGKLELGRKHHIVSRYEPFKHAISFDFLPGAFFNGRGIGPNIRFEIGYNVNRVLKLGIGTGYACYTTHLKYTVWEWFEPAGAYESENFRLPFIPLYLDISLNFKSNRTTTFLSFNIGASFPLAGSVNCKATYNGSSYEASTYYLKIDKIQTGLYFGIGAGMKYFFTPFFEGGVSAGFNMSINAFTGNYYRDQAFTEYDYPHAAPHATTGFGINLMFGFNLDTGKSQGKHPSW